MGIVTHHLLLLLQFQLYRLSCTDDQGSEKFLSRVWCLLRRYQVTTIGSAYRFIIYLVIRFIIYLRKLKQHITCSLVYWRSCLGQHSMRAPVYKGHFQSTFFRLCTRFLVSQLSVLLHLWTVTSSSTALPFQTQMDTLAPGGKVTLQHTTQYIVAEYLNIYCTLCWRIAQRNL